MKMKKAVIVFRTKTEVFRLIDELYAYGIRAATTSTPKEAGIGCGIAVETDLIRVPVVRRIIAGGGYGGYYGIFSVERFPTRTVTTRI